MKNTFYTLILVFFSQIIIAQNVKNFKTKTSANKYDRTMMLDILRANLYQEFKQEFVFVVNHFKVSNGYAWFEGNAQRRDRAKINLPDDYDCCHVEALFKKSNGKWYIIESGAFSTDVWYDGIWEDHDGVPRAIFK